MSRHSRASRTLCARFVGAVVIGVFALAGETDLQSVNDTIWVANRGTHTIRGFDAATGAVVQTVAMAPNSQPGDLAYAKGKLYVAEEFGTPPGDRHRRRRVRRGAHPDLLPTGSRPHHVHASRAGTSLRWGCSGRTGWRSSTRTTTRCSVRGTATRLRRMAACTRAFSRTTEHALSGERRRERWSRTRPTDRIRLLAHDGARARTSSP